MRRGDEGERGGAGVKKHGAYGGVCMHAWVCMCVCVFWGMCVGGVVTHFLGCSDKAGETAGDGHERRRRRGGGNAACTLEEIRGLSVCCVQQHQYLMKTLSADTVPVYLNKHNPSTPSPSTPPTS